MDQVAVLERSIDFPRVSLQGFKVFSRLHREREFEWTGAGLAIVRRIVDRHGGKVWATGREGAGATFWCTIPEGPE